MDEQGDVPQCLSEETLAGFISGDLERTALAHAKRHLEGCARCLAVAARGMTSATPAVVSPFTTTDVPPSSRLKAGFSSSLPVVLRSRYRIDSEIARGGMGRILAAHDAHLNRPVAIKEMLVTASPELLERFEREVLLTARLQHPMIVSVLEAGRWENGDPFYAMRLIRGRSLAAALDDAPTLEARLPYLQQLAAATEAIAYAHSEHIVHRDLKPANILVGDFGETVVIDWGLGKVIGDNEAHTAHAVEAVDPILTAEGAVLGTPAYMAPEQASGKEVDERADVWALGAILYHLLTGRPPLGMGHAQPVPLKRLIARAPTDLVTIVEKAMADAPAQRYRSAVELSEDLQRFLAGRLVGAHRYTIGQHLLRYVRRNRALINVAAGLVTLLIAFSIYGIRRIIHERNNALAERNLAESQRNKYQTESAAAENLVHFILSDLRDELYKLGKLQLLRGIGNEVASYYDQLQVIGIDADPLSRRAAALEILGEVAWSQQDRKASASHYRAAIAIRERLIADAPGRPEWRVALARCHEKLGMAVEDHDRPAAVREYARATELLEPLLKDPSAGRDARSELGITLMRIGDGARFRGNLDEAVDSYRRSVEIGGPDEETASTAARLSLSESMDREAQVLSLRHDFGKALVLDQQSLAIREKLHAKEPGNAIILNALQVSHLRVARVLDSEGRLADAAREQDAAVTLARQLTERDPDNATWLDTLIVNLSNRGEIRRHLHELDAAWSDFSESRDLLQKLVDRDRTHVRRRRNLAIAENKLGLLCLDRKDFVGAAQRFRTGIEVEQALVNQDVKDVDSLAMLAADQQNMGDVLLRQSRTNEAVDSYRSAVANQEKILALDSKRAEARQALAMAMASLAEGRRRQPNGGKDAGELHDHAVAMLRELATQKLLDSDGTRALKILEKGWMPLASL